MKRWQSINKPFQGCITYLDIVQWIERVRINSSIWFGGHSTTFESAIYI